MIWLLSRLRAWVVGLGAALVLGVVLLWQAWRGGYKAREAEEDDETLDRLEQGRDRVRDGRDRGSRDERLHANDSEWDGGW